MKAILPVAGVGSRLRPHTHTVPKALVHVAGKPILGHILDSLQPAGVDEVVLVVGYLGEKIVEYVKNTYDLKVQVVDQEERLGLGHAIWMTRDCVKPGEPILIVLGDTIVEADLGGVLERESLPLASGKLIIPAVSVWCSWRAAALSSSWRSRKTLQQI